MMRHAFVVFLTIALAGCGFQLRGSGGQVLDVERVSITGSKPELMDELEDTLKSIGVSVNEFTDPEYVINIGGESLSRRAVATSGNITVSEYELLLRAQFSVSSSSGEAVIPSAEVRVERIYSFDATNFVSNNEEEAVLLEEMRQDLAAQLVRRFSATLRKRSGEIPAAQ